MVDIYKIPMLSIILATSVSSLLSNILHTRVIETAQLHYTLTLQRYLK